MSNISILSSNPLVLTHTDQMYRHLHSALLERLNNIKSVPFEFSNNKGDLIKEKYRYSYAIDEIFSHQDTTSYIKKFAQSVVPEFLKSLKNQIYEEGYHLKEKENLKYCLRIRVFEDKKGYSLQPHKDSEDTIFSFILQLDSNNTRTAIYNKGRQFKLRGKFSKDPEEVKHQVASVINKICPDEEIFMGESQFRKNIGLWTNNKFYRFEEINNWLGLQEFNEKILNVDSNTIYGISNSLMNYINSSRLDKANETNYHGVRPIQQESRRLLIMDLIAQPTLKEVLMMRGVNSDKNSYYLIYGPEKCRELTDLLS